MGKGVSSMEQYITIDEYKASWDEENLRYNAFHGETGIGMIMIGVPNDYDKFIYALEDESCPPIIAREILNDLINNGKRITTVMNQINLVRLNDIFEYLNVKLYLCAPLKNLENNLSRIAYAGVALQKILLGEKYDPEYEKGKFIDIDNDLVLKEIEHGENMFKKYGRNINKKWLR